MTLQKQEGGIDPILCGEIWCHCFVSLGVNATVVRNEMTKFFTSMHSTYGNFRGITLFKQEVSDRDEMGPHIE
jgi:hypothetical protein